ncbi:MAG: helix-turn-helix transcriptional regulator [Rudaea sp.]
MTDTTIFEVSNLRFSKPQVSCGARVSAASFKAIFCARLRHAREIAGLSQKQLGIKAGLDEFVASARINRYETGLHHPDIQTVARLASVLDVPTAYLYATDKRLARMIAGFNRLSQRKQSAILRQLPDADY